jgi:hypothetical protein
MRLGDVVGAALGASALIVVVACSGNVAQQPAPPFHSSGNAGGPFVPKDGAAFFDDVSANSVDVLMTDYTGACSMGFNSSHVDAGALRMFVQGTDPVTAGMFVVDGMQYSATLTRWDASCARAYENATGGTISLTTVTATEVKGTFDLKFPDGELKGDFDAPKCVPPITDGGSVCVGADGG